MNAKQKSVAWYVPQLNPRRASLRYRCIYPMRTLQSQGYVAEIYEPARRTQYDSVIFDAWELFPSIGGEAAAERMLALAQELKSAGQTIVLDNCDNQFAGQSSDPGWEASCQRLRQFVALTDDLVVCSNDLAGVMRSHCAPVGRVHVIGDPVEEEIRFPGDTWWRSLLSPQRKQSWWHYWQHRQALAADRRAGRIPLIWFGSHGNSFAEGGMLELLNLRTALESLHRRYPLSLSVVSNHRRKFNENFGDWQIPLHYLDWDRVTFLDVLKLHDLSVIPSRLNDFTRCKSANRLVLSLFHGLAVVADAIPSYLEFNAVTRLGDLPQGLEDYLARPELRIEHVRLGQVQAARQYSHAAIGTRWGRVLSDQHVDAQDGAE